SATSPHNTSPSLINPTPPSSRSAPDTSSVSAAPSTPLTLPTFTPATSDTPTPTISSHDTSQPATQHGYTSTLYITSHQSGSVTTIGTVVSSGVLRTGSPNTNNNRFAHNPGAIIGTTFGAVIAVAVAGIWIWVALRRHKERRTRELTASTENVMVMPDGGWRPPLEDGDEEDMPPANYAGLLASLGDISEAQAYDPAQPVASSSEDAEEGRSSEHAAQSSEHGGGKAASSYSHQSSSRNHPAMTGFGQAAETMSQPVMAMADDAMLVSARAAVLALANSTPSPDEVGPDPGSWLNGKDDAYQPRPGKSPSGKSSSQGHSSQEKYGRRSSSKLGSSDDDPFAGYPMQSSSQTHASSSSDIGSSHRRSVDGKGQSPVPPVPPTSFSYRKRSGSESAMKGILGRLRGGRASSSPAVADVFAQSQQFSPPPPLPRSSQPSSLRRRDPYGKSRSASPTPFMFGPPVIDVRAPTPRPTSPSSLLRPQSPVISRKSSQPMLSAVPADIAWPGLEVTNPSPPSPSATLGDSNAEGLLDPRLPWRLTQARMDSSTSLRDHEDYSRPLGELIHNHDRQHSMTTFDSDDDDRIRDI
ncbi:hypothetical protein HWV62_26865, partial [Athelia sp. TMB]